MIQHMASGQELESTHLPIVVINTDQSIRDEPKVIAEMGIINNENGVNRPGDPINGYNGKIGIEFRGNSTQLFDKKSYSIELRDDQNQDQDASILGMPSEEDWILYGSPIDKTHIRNVMSFEIWRQMGHWASNTVYCELILDGEYRGTYVMMERIKRDDNRLPLATLREQDTEGDELTGGYIIRLDWNEDEGWTSRSTSMGGERMFYQYYYPRADAIQGPQRTYIRNYFRDFEQAVLADNYQNDDGGKYHAYIDLDSFADLFIINELSRSVDAYKLSTFLHKDKGERLKAGPIWDFNLAYGNTVYCGGSDVRGWTYLQEESSCDDLHLMPRWWEPMMEDDLFRTRVFYRWQMHREDFLNEDFLFAFIDGQVDKLGVAIDRNFERWDYLGDNLWDEPEPVQETYEQEIQLLKNWLTDRIAWLDSQFEEVQVITGINNKPEISVFPNPTQSSLKLSIGEFRNVSLRLMDMDGRILSSQTSINEDIDLDFFGSLNPGLYMVHVYNQEFSIIRKVIKE